MSRLAFALAAGCIAAITLGAPAIAQNYPSKPVTLITPAAAGGSPDVILRILADRLSRIWKQQAVVVNRPGAGGLIAAQAASASTIERDGYTLYVTQASTFTVLPIMMEGKMGLNLQTAFTPIGMVGEQPIALAVNKDVPVNSVAELVAMAAKSKDPMLFAASNRGGQTHLTGELFRERAKANISFVHAAGAAASLNDVIAARIPIMFEGLAGLSAGIHNGGIKLLAVASQKRLPNLPDLPAINETIPGVVSSGWIVIMAPAGVPDAIVQKVNGDIRTVVAMPDVIERFQTLGTYSRDLTPSQTEQFMRSEEKLWWPIVREINQAQGTK